MYISHKSGVLHCSRTSFLVMKAANRCLFGFAESAIIVRLRAGFCIPTQLCWVLLLSLHAVLNLSGLAAQETVLQFFARAEAAHAKVQDYKATWRMEIDGKSSVSTTYYKTPGNVLLEYSVPQKRFILITDKQLAIYDSRNNILMTQPLNGAVAGPPSLRIMRRLYSLRYKYNTGSAPVKEKGINEEVIVLLLNPINSSARIEELQVSFYADSLLLRQIVGSWYGSKVEYNFLDIQVNIGLDKTIFKPKDPPGAKEWANFLQD